MKEKILSEQIVPGKWYKTGGRDDLIKSIEELISDGEAVEISQDKSFFRRKIIKDEDKPFADLFEWAEGRTDCHVEIRKLSYGKIARDLYYNGKLISIAS